MLSKALARMTRRRTEKYCPAPAAGSAPAESREPTKTAPAREELRPAPRAPNPFRDIAALRARMPRVVRPEVLAGMVVQSIRDEMADAAGLPDRYWLPADVVEVAAIICREFNVEPVHERVLLEAVKTVPGVRYSRWRVLQGAEFALVRHRLVALGRSADRVQLFWVGDEPAAARPAGRRGTSAGAPVKRRSARPATRPSSGDMPEKPNFADDAPDLPLRRAA